MGGHELAHLIYAKKGGFEIASPLLPPLPTISSTFSSSSSSSDLSSSSSLSSASSLSSSSSILVKDTNQGDDPKEQEEEQEEEQRQEESPSSPLVSAITTLPIPTGTILPFLGVLPYLSVRTNLRTSPPSPNALFDFALAGPATGYALSFVSLLVGLYLTTASIDGSGSIVDIITATASAKDLFPTVPLSLLKHSTLGATVIANVLDGGGMWGERGFGNVVDLTNMATTTTTAAEAAASSASDLATSVVTSSGMTSWLLTQDPSTPIPLHPLVIAGFAGMMINALDSLPYGGTDGGRMCQGLLGRYPSVLVSEILSFLLPIYCLFILGGGENGLYGYDIFPLYLIVIRFAQRDPEIMQINEVDENIRPGIGRVAAGLIMWSTAIMTLVPLR